MGFTEIAGIILAAITSLIVVILFFVSIFRLPITSTKVTFILFGISLINWNFIEVLQVFSVFSSDVFKIFQVISSIFVFYTMVVYALHFPSFRRRETRVTNYTAFVGGMGYLILMQTFSIPIVSQYFPLESKFFETINSFLHRSFSVLCLMSFLIVIIYKLTHAVGRLKKFLLRSVSYSILLTLLLLLFNYNLGMNFEILRGNISYIFIDLLFISIFILSLLQFRFIEFYPGILSIFIYGELPNLVIHKVAPANLKGGADLKEELWKMYESENWNFFITEFWFSLIVDESLDNAVEHGGKRTDDEITVQVYETSKFIDIYVIDNGKGFDPDIIPDPSLPERKSIPTGRGIYILKKFFYLSWNFLGNEVRVRISKNPADNPPENE